MAALALNSLLNTGTATSQGFVWPRQTDVLRQRHPSRPRIAYRARGTRPTAPAISDNRDAWYAHSTAFTKQRRMRSGVAVALIGAPVLIAAAIALMSLGSLWNVTPIVPAERQFAVPNLAEVVLAPRIADADLPRFRSAGSQPYLQTPTQPLETVTAPVAPILATTPANAPTVLFRSPSLPVPTSSRVDATIPNVVSAPPVINTAGVLAAPAPDHPFACSTCTPAFPRFGQVEIAIFVASEDAPQASSLLKSLADYDTIVRQAAILPTRNEVRFYRAEDADPAAQLASLYHATLIDLTWFSPDTEIKRVDIFLAKPNVRSRP